MISFGLGGGEIHTTSQLRPAIRPPSRSTSWTNLNLMVRMQPKGETSQRDGQAY
jgi:hypothetical protein